MSARTLDHCAPLLSCAEAKTFEQNNDRVGLRLVRYTRDERELSCDFHVPGTLVPWGEHVDISKCTWRRVPDVPGRDYGGGSYAGGTTYWE